MANPFWLPEAERMSAEDILNKFAVEDGNQNIFQIGCCSGRVTIASQQQRALNLVWALERLERLRDKKIILIGAGFAGLTCAAALKVTARNCDIKLCDYSGEALHLQKGNLSRFVQPYIYDWPINSSRYPKTFLPYLNWYGAEAGVVTTEVLKQWRRLKIVVHQKRAVRVRSGIPAKIRWTEGREEADLVIIAVGFGLENGVANGGSRSYWSNDSLNQSHLGRNYPAKVLVSGYGDGGLIDVIRATISEFNHIDFTHDLISDPDIHEQLRLCADEAIKAGSDWDTISFPKTILESLKRVKRPNVDVYFNASEKWFRNKTSSIFNRLIVAMLKQNGDIKFWPGEVRGNEIAYTKGFFCVPTIQKGKRIIFRADHIVLRHGTEKECPKLLLSPTWAATMKKWSQEGKNPISDLSPYSHYQNKYLLDRFMSYRGELEYEVVYLRTSQEEAEELKLQIKQASNNRKRVRSEIFRMGDRPDLLPNQDWQPVSQLIQVPGFPPIVINTTFPNVNSIGLRVSTKSRENFESFMEKMAPMSYYLYGVKITRRLFSEIGTDPDPYIPYRFPGSGAQLRLVEVDDGWWLRVLQRVETNVEADGFRLRDAHGLLSADDLLAIARNQWNVSRKIIVGWRIGASPENNLNNLTR